MYRFGTIVLARFPFTDLSGDKRRPALVVSAIPNAGDAILCFITSVPRTGLAAAAILPDRGNGLRVPSAVRFDEIVTLNTAVIAGQLGSASQNWLQDNKSHVFASFGFDPSGIHGVAPKAG